MTPAHHEPDGCSAAERPDSVYELMRRDIEHLPQTLTAVLASLNERSRRQEFKSWFERNRVKSILVSGSGTSDSLAKIAASIGVRLNLQVHSVQTSELIDYPAYVACLPPQERQILVLPSRSGQTREAVIAAQEFLLAGSNRDLIVVTCTPNSQLSRISHAWAKRTGSRPMLIELPMADEAKEQLVQTKSHLSMLVALVYCMADSAGRADVLMQLNALPALVQSALDQIQNHPQGDLITRMLGSPRIRQIEHALFLGSGPARGMAHSAAKLFIETAGRFSAASSVLDIRHDLLAAGSSALFVYGILGSDTPYVFDRELKIMRECAARGCPTLILTGRRAADTIIGGGEDDGHFVLSLDGDDFARSLAARIPIELLALGLAEQEKRILAPNLQRATTEID